MSHNHNQCQIEVTVPILTDRDSHTSVKQTLNARHGVAQMDRVTNGGHQYMRYVTDPVESEAAKGRAEKLREYLGDLYPDYTVSSVRGPEGPFANTKYPRYEITVS